MKVVPSLLASTSSRCSRIAVLGTALAGAALAQAPFTTTTDNFESVTNFNVETVRGMAFDPATNSLWAINTHGSTLVRITSIQTSQPTNIHRTLNNPVALALWNSSPSSFVLVVGGGTHGIAFHDRSDGTIRLYGDLPSEPADIVVDPEGNFAYVSCANAGVVAKIDLNASLVANAVTFTSIAIPATRPTFLSIDLGPTTATSDNFVFVAPLLSGNNTTFERGFDRHTRVVRLGAQGLPDQDLFRIDSGGTVIPVLTGAGTLLTAHGKGPNGRYWMLGTESFNENPSEPANRGVFAQNRLLTPSSQFALPPNPINAVAPADIRSLDTSTALFFPANTTGEPNANKPLSFPFGLAFRTDGIAAVAGSTSDTIRILDSNGGNLKNVGLKGGAIPRSVLFSPDNNTLWVYCWGRNEILGFDFNALLFQATTTPIVTWDLGVDPLQATMKTGRRIWYDADNSLNKNVSCNHCHPRGATDMLGWMLSDEPTDRKDTMVTQSLLSIEDSFPYHWRGERTLADFNVAFPGLLGGNKLSEIDDPVTKTTDLDAFQEFVFSLQAPANPRQRPDRQVSAAGAAAQTIFNTRGSVLVGFPSATCASCHGNEVGTNGLVTPDNATMLPTNGHLDVAHLRQLEAKISQPTVNAVVSGVSAPRPRIGFGLSHDGDEVDLLDFLTGPFSLTPSEMNDMATFVGEFDQGIAPRTHMARLMDQSNAVSVENDLNTNFIPQASAPQFFFDIAAVGHRIAGGVATPTQLFFEASAGTFRDQVGVAFTLAQLRASALTGNLKLLFVAVPPGNGRRFGVDPDDDGLNSAQEMTAQTDAMIADKDGDKFPDGYEVSIGTDPLVATTPAQVAAADINGPGITVLPKFVGGRIMKFFVVFSEPTRYAVTVQRRDPVSGQFFDFGPVQSHPAFVVADTLVVQGLQPSIPFINNPEQFQFLVKMKDLAGNSSGVNLTNGISVPTDPTAIPNNGAFFPSLVTKPLALNHTAGQPTVTVGIDVDNLWDGFFNQNNTGNRTIVAQVAIQQPNGTFLVGDGVNSVPVPTAIAPTLLVNQQQSGERPSTSFGLPGLLGAAGSLVPGRLLTATTGSSGAPATFGFQLPTSLAGTKVRFTIVGIYELVSGILVGHNEWMMPMSPTSGRFVEFNF